MNFKFPTQMDEESSAILSEEKFARWEQESANGKWFWIFKRTALWLTLMIVMFGAVEFYSPETLSFDSNQIFVALFMFVGFIVGNILEWSKMEKEFNSSSVSLNKD